MTMRIRKRLDVASATRKQAKRGFTLTEIAIVLGIVGLILGAIWVAAAAVYQNLRVSRATTELITITQNVRAMYATGSAVDPLADMTVNGVQAGTALTYIQSGIFPGDMVIGGNQIINPWSGGVAINSGIYQNAADSFSVNFDAVPLTACIGMLTGNTGTGRDSGLYDAGAAKTGTLTFKTAFAPGGPPPPIAFPMLSSVAQATCTGAGGSATVPVNIGFFFKLKG